MKHLIAPSLLSADFSRLGEEIMMLNESETDWVHVDLMDGTFVPNISIGFNVMESIKGMSSKFMDFHLMIEEPIRYVDVCKDLGADAITVHYEACSDLKSTIAKIKSHGIKQGVVLKPDTPVEVLADTITEYDIVLLMSVYPGFGGQKFIEESYGRIKALKEMIVQNKASTLIEVDGGVNLDNAANLIKAGVDVLVAGNAVFKTPDPKETIRKFKEIL